MEYLERAPENNRYHLVRKVAAITGYCGGNRTAELRHLLQSSVEEHHDGFYVTFIPAKQRQHIETSRYNETKSRNIEFFQLKIELQVSDTPWTSTEWGVLGINCQALPGSPGVG